MTSSGRDLRGFAGLRPFGPLRLWLCLFVCQAAHGDEPPLDPYSEAHFMATAKKIVGAINTDDQETLQRLFSPSMREVMPESRTRPFTRRIVEQRGLIVGVGPPRIAEDHAKFALKAQRGEWEMRLTLANDGSVDGLYIDEPVPAIPVPKRNTVPLRLPFRGRRAVTSGGPTPELNLHLLGPRESQFGIDFVAVDEQGRTCRGDGSRNEDHYSYGQEVLAVAAGSVVKVVDGLPDNRPGSRDSSNSGNAIVLRHGDDEYSVYLHLRPYRARVKVGDRVVAGQVIGECGNSGNSSDAHIHLHLTNSPVVQDATGFPPYFERLRVTKVGRFERKAGPSGGLRLVKGMTTVIESDYSPCRGDLVEEATDGDPAKK
jgi:hypothetical protein